MAALWIPRKPLPSSRTNASRSAFCDSSMSRSPSVKKATASKSSRFLAPYLSFFVVIAFGLAEHQEPPLLLLLLTGGRAGDRQHQGQGQGSPDRHRGDLPRPS